MANSYHVYIMTNYLGASLYTGVTNDLTRRVEEHREGKPGSFTGRYKVARLIYVEETDDVWAALEREKQIKGWRRSKKLELIATLNPRWADLSVDWQDRLPDKGGQDSSQARNDE